MSDQLPGPPAAGPGALRAGAVVAACAGVVALAAAAFVLSYPGLHAMALQARVSPRLARGYPLIFDVLLVVVMAAALTLRGAGWPSRLFAWVSLLTLLGAAAGADALHASGRRLPAGPAAVTAAILPWALVLIAFMLLLTMLQHARVRRLAAERAGSRAWIRDQAGPDVPVAIPAQMPVPGFEVARPAEEATEVGQSDPAAEAADDDPEMPVFHRVWSTPVPPGDEPGD